MRLLHLVFLLLAACQPLPQPADEPIKDALAIASPAAGPRVTMGDVSIAVELADTFETRKRGLSGRASLAADTGLVLYWNEPTVAKIWMPDMNFPIDVVFVRQGKVVGLYENAQPCPPGGPCPTFGPDTPVDYVLEVPAGSAERWQLKVGDSIQLTR